jgi:tRNA G18 (ribose-2'-O)-methylase SpoU
LFWCLILIHKLIHSEILAERLTPESAINAKRHPVAVMADNIRSLYNIGSLFRTCDSALADRLILTGYTPHPPRIEIEKTALGAVDTVPWEYFSSPVGAVEEMKRRGYKAIGVEITDKKRSYDSFTFSDFPMCLVLGNELVGMGTDTLAACDDAIEIPMYGTKHSLNVGVAAGIVLFEAVRAWRNFCNEQVAKL